MTTAALTRKLERMKESLGARNPVRQATLDRLRKDPARILSEAGIPPDPWQANLLRSHCGRMLLLCSRQAGKSTTAAAVALREALLRPGSLVLLLSPTLRQSSELFADKVVRLYNALGRPVEANLESALRMELANGSRVVSLPGDEKSIRGYSGVRLLVVDEASRVGDALYFTIRPMLAVSRGKLVCLSTPFGKRGFFFDAWHGEGSWTRVKVTADQCPRITREFLAEEERELGPRWYRQEYHCSFEDAVDSVFTHADVMAACADDLAPLF
jgi:hypothetical protein